MRVVVLTAAYPSATEPQRAGFIETLTRELARGPGGIDVTVVAPQIHDADAELEERRGILVRRFPAGTGGRRLKEIERPGPRLLAAYAWSGLRALVREARERAADVILAHWVLPSGPIARVAARRLGLPYVLVAHGTDVNRHAGSRGPLRWAARWAVAGAAHVVAVSGELRRLLAERLGATEAGMTVVPMGVDAAVFSAAGWTDGDRVRWRHRLGCAANLPVILYAGDWLKAKGLLDLLAALRILRSQGLVLETVLAGGGPLAPELRAQSTALGLRLVGRLAPDEVAEWMRAADLVVLPSHAEGCPVSIQEALSVGTPVVATRVGGIPDIVDDGVTGWLASPEDPASLAAALSRALSGPELLGAARQKLRSSPPDHSAARRAGEIRAVLEGARNGV